MKNHEAQEQVNEPSKNQVNSINPKSSKKLVKIFSIVFLTVFFIALLGGIFAYIYYQNEVTKPTMVNDKYLIMTIDKGTSTKEVAQELEDLGVIPSKYIMYAYMKQHPDKHIQAGYYKVPTKDLTFAKLIDEFQKGSFEQKLTFIEGWRTEEYADYLETTMNSDFAQNFLNSKYTKEGYMFPDTYIIEKTDSANKLASWMRNTFDKKFTDQMLKDAQKRNLTKEQIVILASIIEREMNIKKDRPIVAGILIKRLQNDWPLQADATVQYAKGHKGNWWPRLKAGDTKSVNSPYNTYLNKGLPPAPICNPSLDAIKSVIYYKETPYWFYITDHNGVTHYSETLEEHNANVQKYLN